MNLRNPKNNELSDRRGNAAEAKAALLAKIRAWKERRQAAIEEGAEAEAGSAAEAGAMAEAGKSYREILKHYYPGTDIRKKQ